MKYEGPSAFQTEVRTGKRSFAERVGARVPWLKRIPPMFMVIVVVPTLLTSIYFVLIAAPMYESEALFVVHQKSESTGQASGGSGGGSVLQSFGLGGGEDSTHAQEVLEYMKSRDAVALLDHDSHLRAMLARPESDFVSRFPRPFEGNSFEDLFKGFKRFVTVGLDTQTEISTLKVVAYRPEDARAIAETLLAGGENLVNRMNDRSLSDTVGQASRQLADAEMGAAQAQTALTVFRNREHLVDPDMNTQAGLELMTSLQSQLANLKAQREGLAASAPQSPQLPVLDRNIAAYQGQIDAQQAQQAGQANSLAPKVGQYERLYVDQQIAAKSLAAAEEALEAARLEAARRQLYLERVVNPNLPDKSEQPQRLMSILTVLICTLVAYAAIALFVAGLREHRQ
jgi:capsular polysaccharide transport system permease protein